MSESNAARAKAAAAERAAQLVESGMRVGLGTGSTAELMVKALARRIREESLRIDAVATSGRCADLARSEGIALGGSAQLGDLDITIDGADECDRHLNLIKGGGGALLTEKIVAQNSARLIIIADQSKMVDCLGSFPLPVEVAQFGWNSVQEKIVHRLADIGFDGARACLRRSQGSTFVSEEGNFIIDFSGMGRIDSPAELQAEIISLAGVVETGLFPAMCDLAIFGNGDGSVLEVEAEGQSQG